MTNIIGYLDTRNNSQKKILRPNWWYDDGNETPVTDAYLISEGIYPLYSSPPTETSSEYFVSIGYTILEDRAEEIFDAVTKEISVRKAWMINKSKEKYYALIALGYPHASDQHVDIDADGRANLSGMALTALLALQSMTTWPEDYARGWVTREGTKIPLTATDAIGFAAAAGAFYSSLVQRLQDIEDDILAAITHEDLDTIEETYLTSWPGE